MILRSTRSIHAPPWLVFDMVRHVDVHAAAVPEIQARAEEGRQHGILQIHESTRWSARYFGIRFFITMQVTRCDSPVRYEETNTTGPFHLFRHVYTVENAGDGTSLLRDELTLEAGWGFVGRLVDRFLLAPRLQQALDTRMDHLKQWSEDETWRQWMSEEHKHLDEKESAHENSAT